MAKKDKKDQDKGEVAPPSQVGKAPEMVRAWALYERGDNRDSAREARRILSSDASEAAKKEARELLNAVRVEPGALFTFVALVALFTGIISALVFFHRQG